MGSSGLPVCQVCLCLLLLSSYLSFSSGEKCVRFEFADPDKPLTVIEGKPVTIPFRLKTNNCASSNNFTISVSKPVSGRFIGYLCRFRHVNGACTDPPGLPGCTCPKEGGGWYTFRKDAVKADDTAFTWKTDSIDIGEEARIALKIISGRFTLSRQNDIYLAKKGEDVDVECDLKNGNLTVKARLTNREGKELISSDRGEIRHKLNRVRCQDAGLFQCQASETNLNMTARLLVEDLPEISYENAAPYPAGKDADLKFRVCAHTEKVQTCRMTRIPEDGDAHDCKSNLMGTPPDLTLTVRLNNVRKQMEGQWRLELTNDAGTSHEQFEVAVLDSDPAVNSSDSHSSNDGHTMDAALMGGIIVSVNIGTIIIVVIIVVIIVRRARRRRQSTAEEVELAPANNPPAIVARPPSIPARPGCSVHVYDDIRGEQPKGYMALDYPPPPLPGRKNKRNRDRDAPPPIPPRD